MPPPPPDAEDVHRRDTVNKKVSPEFLAYLRSFDSPIVPAAEGPIDPVPWTRSEDDGPVIAISFDSPPDGVELGEHDEDEAALLAEPQRVSFEAEIEDDEIPSFRDNRALYALIGATVFVAGVAAAFFYA